MQDEKPEQSALLWKKSSGISGKCSAAVCARILYFKACAGRSAGIILRRPRGKNDARRKSVGRRKIGTEGSHFRTVYPLIFTLALLLGILCAWKEDTWLDRIICKVGTITGCIPEFWLSLLLILVFSMQLKWLPSSGAYSVGKQADFSDRVCHLILPMTVVVLSHLWYYAYMIRNKILDEVREEYVLLARAKGLKRKTVLFRHCLRNTIPSYLGIMAISVPHVLGGTYIVETVFSYPGIGTLAYESARYKDYNLLMLLCLMSGIVVILCNMAAQIINERIDPRMREKEAAETSEVMML